VRKIDEFLEKFGKKLLNKSLEEYIKKGKHDKRLEILKEFLTENASKLAEPTLWSQKMYITLLEQFDIQDENKNKIHPDFEYVIRTIPEYEEHELSSYKMEGGIEEDYLVFKFLLENNEKWEDILIKKFDVGCSISYKSLNDHPKVSIFLLTRTLTRKSVARNSKKINSIVLPSLDLTDKIFDSVNYKEKIVEGKYDLKGNIIKATFTLDDMTVKEERIILSPKKAYN
jgi:hypothetical protein